MTMDMATYTTMASVPSHTCTRGIMQESCGHPIGSYNSTAVLLAENQNRSDRFLNVPCSKYHDHTKNHDCNHCHVADIAPANITMTLFMVDFPNPVGPLLELLEEAYITIHRQIVGILRGLRE